VVFISTNADPATGRPLISRTDHQRHWSPKLRLVELLQAKYSFPFRAAKAGCSVIRRSIFLFFKNFAEAEDGDATFSLVRPRSWRSGCVPALPDPPLRSGLVYRIPAKTGALTGTGGAKKCLNDRIQDCVLPLHWQTNPPVGPAPGRPYATALLPFGRIRLAPYGSGPKWGQGH
jgi:hypothetical protein